MPVQPNALPAKPIQDIVLYCLTPPLFHRYSCLNLCPPPPAWDGLNLKMHAFAGGGIRLVNSLRSTTNRLFLTESGLCSEGVYVA
jgi:hypothetical protein